MRELLVSSFLFERNVPATTNKNLIIAFAFCVIFFLIKIRIND